MWVAILLRVLFLFVISRFNAFNGANCQVVFEEYALSPRFTNIRRLCWKSIDFRAQAPRFVYGGVMALEALCPI